MSFLGALLMGPSVASSWGKVRQRGAQIRGKCWTLKEELSSFLQQLGWTNAWGSWLGVQGADLLPRNAFPHAKQNKPLFS